MLLHVTVVLLISVCVYCDEKTEKSNATVEAKEVASNKTGGDSSNADTKLRMLGNLNPNEHFQKQEMVNQYLSKSDPGNGRMGQQMGGNFPIGGEMQRMPLMHQQSNNMPNPDISINEQLRQNILNSIRGGQQSQNALCNVSGRVLFHGDKWTSPGVCGLFTCADNNFRTLTTSCPSLSYQEEANCFIEEQDLSRSFPHCCPKLVCSSRERSGETRKYGDFLF
uniref:Single domain-containing protein n=1 Tax=Graphocephala atropunctata TaxID=36148 RepID=A0A1B6MLW4_9HEMI